MKDHPFISVVIPAFNEEKNIEEALKALAGQDYPKESYEIIVVDNDSTDETEKIAAKYAKVINYKVKGVGAARQAGFEVARGDIVASTDADTIVTTSWLSDYAEHFKREQIVGVGGAVWPIKKNPFFTSLFSIYDLFLRLNQTFGRVLPWGSNMAVRKTAFDQIGGFDTHLKTSEDADLALRLLKRFGKRSVIYSKMPVAYTSTRKVDNPRVLVKYFWDGVGNYVNVVLLRKNKSGEMMDVR